MQHVTVGMTGLRVAPIAFGTWQLGGEWGAFDERRAIAAIQRARELGVNLFDTARAYGFGSSERLLGRALREDLRSARQDIAIATEGGLRKTDAGMVRDSSRDALRAGVDESLLTLGVDFIDLYQVHWPDPRTALSETAAALQEMVDEGIVRHVGVSNFDRHQITEFARTRPVETVQPPYHLFRRGIEDDLLPYAQHHDIGVLVYGPLAQGLLAGGIAEDTRFPFDDWRSKSAVFRGETLRRNVDVVRELRRFADKQGLTVGQLAVAWVLANPAVDVAIVGSRSPAHIEEAVTVADVLLTPAGLADIDRIMTDAVSIDGPSPETV